MPPASHHPPHPPQSLSHGENVSPEPPVPPTRKEDVVDRSRRTKLASRGGTRWATVPSLTCGSRSLGGRSIGTVTHAQLRGAAADTGSSSSARPGKKVEIENYDNVIDVTCLFLDCLFGIDTV